MNQVQEYASATPLVGPGYHFSWASATALHFPWSALTGSLNVSHNPLLVAHCVFPIILCRWLSFPMIPHWPFFVCLFVCFLWSSRWAQLHFSWPSTADSLNISQNALLLAQLYFIWPPPHCWFTERFLWSLTACSPNFSQDAPLLAHLHFPSSPTPNSPSLSHGLVLLAYNTGNMVCVSGYLEWRDPGKHLEKKAS